MSEAYRKAEMFLLPYRKAEWVPISLPWSLWATSLGYLFSPPLFPYMLLISVGVMTPKFCHSLLLLFHLAVLFLTDPLYSIIPHTLGLEETKHFSRGPSCVLSLCSPQSLPGLWMCLLRGVGASLSSVPPRIRVAGSPRVHSAHIFFPIYVKIKMQQL